MADASETVVVRQGHRPGRDERMTTHVGLTARALGADAVVLPTSASHAVETVRDVTDRFGGPFDVRAVRSPREWLRSWEGYLVHLTMYGLPYESTVPEVAAATGDDGLAVVVGGGKVGGDLFDRATWNVAVTNQPHSEVAALAVFLERLRDETGGVRTWEDADREIVPSEAGKRVRDVDS